MSEMSGTPAEEEEIGVWSAVWHAFTGKSINHFPRRWCSCGSWATVPDSELIEKASAALRELSPTEDKLDAILSQARETLNEVKALTEYEDGKATRLLTIITFLSALAGVLFGKLTDLYPLYASLAQAQASWFHWGLILVAYLGFAVFVLLTVCGATVTFHALRVRFRYPKPSHDGRAKSFLFYAGILEVSPGEWANSYVSTEDRTQLASDVKLRYFKNYVVESYLIATKVADKVRYLVPAQALLAFATRVLVFWLIIYAITFAFVPTLDKHVSSIPAPATIASTPLPSSPNP